MEAARQRYTFAEYLALEAISPIKHEYCGGGVWAMAGGSPEHAAIAVNVSTALASQLRDKPCRVFSSDLRIRVRATGLATYPDVSVVCNSQIADPDDPGGNTIINPVVIVEVLSPSTEGYDRGEKLAHYKTIPSLQEIVLVAHDQHRIEVWRRADDAWTLEVVANQGQARLQAVDCDLDLDEVYRNPLGQ